MEKSNIITRIIKKFLSGRFSVETEEKVQRWIMKEENAEEKEKASLEYWNELDTEADSKRYNKEHLENIVLYHKFVRIVAVVIPICLLAGGLLYYIPSENEQIEISTAYGEQKRLVLPDSSEVWLNAGSTITYPKTFTKAGRTDLRTGMPGLCNTGRDNRLRLEVGDTAECDLSLFRGYDASSGK